MRFRILQFFLFTFTLFAFTVGSIVLRNFKSEVVLFLTRFVRQTDPNCEVLITSPSTVTNLANDIEFDFITFLASAIGQSVIHAGQYILNINQNFSSYRRKDDMHKRAISGTCVVNVFLISEYVSGASVQKLFNLITPIYLPITRKDRDAFFFIYFDKSAGEIVLRNEFISSKVKFKLFISPTESKTQIEFSTIDISQGVLRSLTFPPDLFPNIHLNVRQRLASMFPDFTRDLHGKPIRISVPKIFSLFEMELRSDGRFHPKRGVYHSLLKEARIKMNFSYDLFPSSLDGGTGKRFENGTWGGSIGDVLYDQADVSLHIAHIYNRHRFVEWGACVKYESIGFVCPKPTTYFSSKAIIRPFTYFAWIAFFATFATVFCIFVIISKLEMKLCGQPSWTSEKIVEYIVTTLLEQNPSEPAATGNSLRICSSFWFLFALVTVAAYKSKLTVLMAFPLKQFVPETFQELAASKFQVGLFVLGKGDAAYTIFSSARGNVYETIFRKVVLYSDPVECILKATKQNFCCIIWEGTSEYIAAKNGSLKGGDPNVVQDSKSTTSFVEDGLIFERQSIYRKGFDKIVRNFMSMGLIRKWKTIHMRQLRLERQIREKGNPERDSFHSKEDGEIHDDISKRGLRHFAAPFLVWAIGIGVSSLVLGVEFVRKTIRPFEFEFEFYE